MEEKVKLYWVPGSAYCRVVSFFLTVNKIPTEHCQVLLRNEQHKSPEYTKINPHQKVPCLSDGDFNIMESTVILRYLCNTKNVDVSRSCVRMVVSE